MRSCPLTAFSAQPWWSRYCRSRGHSSAAVPFRAVRPRPHTPLAGPGWIADDHSHDPCRHLPHARRRHWAHLLPPRARPLLYLAARGFGRPQTRHDGSVRYRAAPVLHGCGISNGRRDLHDLLAGVVLREGGLVEYGSREDMDRGCDRVDVIPRGESVRAGAEGGRNPT